MATVKNLVNQTILDKGEDSKLSYASVLSTQERILRLLFVNRSISDKNWTVKKIAERLNLSVNVIRQNLNLLEKERLVIRARIKSQTGRPAMVYSIHENAFDLFPKRYMEFSLALISAYKARYGVEELFILLQTVGKSLAKLLNKNSTRTNQNEVKITFKQKLESKLSLLTKVGYYPELIEDETSFLLKNYNCMLNGIVKIEPLVCVVCETLITELVGKKVVKKNKNINTTSPCIFRIEKKNS